MWVVNINIESKTIQILKGNNENIFMILNRQNFLKQSTNSTNHEEKIDKLNYYRIATLVYQKTSSIEGKNKLQAGRSYIYITSKDS